MTKKKDMGKKAVHFWVPAEYHQMLKKLCVDTGLTLTDIFTQYLGFLKEKHYKQRKALNENSKSSFKLDAGDGGELPSAVVVKQK